MDESFQPFDLAKGFVALSEWFVFVAFSGTLIFSLVVLLNNGVNIICGCTLCIDHAK